jgi:NADH-quinone oxidoreductase subunit H
MNQLLFDILLIGLKIVGIVLGFAFPIGASLTLFGDRKQSALIQNRVGPNRARIPGIPFSLLGIPHLVADTLKMIFKEDIIPDRANPRWHTLAPALAIFPAVVLWAVIPFGDFYCLGSAAPALVDGVYRDVCTGSRLNLFSIANLDAGLLYVFAISSISVYAAAIAGWASNNKYSLLGGLRSSAQMISYEVSMALSLLGLVILYGTLNLNEMAVLQGHLLWGWLPMWGIFLQPLSFFLFLTVMMAETKRAPFNCPEGESEIVAGYFTEFSSMKFGVIQVSEYIATVFVGALVATLFLGGWQVPWLFADGFHFTSDGTVDLALPYWAVVGLRLGAFTVKTLLIVWLQFMLRWTLPTFRYDQIMNLGWKIILPLSLGNLVLTAFVSLVLL